MKVLFISGADQQYGTYHMSVQLLEKFSIIRKDITFVVLTQRNGPLNEWCNKHSVENYVIPYKYCVYFSTNNVVKRTVKYVLKKVYVSLANCIALKILERKKIMQSIDVIHTNINRDLLGEFLSEKYNIPNVTYLREFSRSHFNLRLLYSNQIKRMNQYSAKFIAISNAVREDWIDFGLDEDKVEVIYDGVDPDNYQCKESVYNEDKKLKLVMCGAIYEGKGQLDLVKALAPLVDQGMEIYLDIYGNSANHRYYKSICDYIASNNLVNHISIKGHVDNINEILRQYDVGVVCSKAEGFGLVTIEYMISGLSVIASNTGANPEILQYGRYGRLYPLGNLEIMKRIIVETYREKGGEFLVNNDRIEYAKENFAIEKTERKLADLYTSVIGDK